MFNSISFQGSLSHVGRVDVRMVENERHLGLERRGEQGAHDISELEINGITHWSFLTSYTCEEIWVSEKKFDCSKMKLHRRKLNETQPTGSSSHKAKNQPLFISFLYRIFIWIMCENRTLKDAKYTKIKPD